MVFNRMLYIDKIWQQFGSSLEKCDTSLSIYSSYKKQSKGIWWTQQYSKVVCQTVTSESC